MRSRRRYRRLSLVLPSSISRRSSVAGIPALFDSQFAARRAQMVVRQQGRLARLGHVRRLLVDGLFEKSGPVRGRFHNSGPRKHAPNWRVLSRRTLFNTTRSTCGSWAGRSTSEGKVSVAGFRPVLKTSTVVSQRARWLRRRAICGVSFACPPAVSSAWTRCWSRWTWIITAKSPPGK